MRCITNNIFSSPLTYSLLLSSSLYKCNHEFFLNTLTFECFSQQLKESLILTPHDLHKVTQLMDIIAFQNSQLELYFKELQAFMQLRIPQPYIFFVFLTLSLSLSLDLHSLFLVSRFSLSLCVF
jgi:hypothetical protein